MQLSAIIFLIIYLRVLGPFIESILPLGGLLLFLTLLMTTFVGHITNSWFAFILFLVYVTGLLVLFGYMMAIRPNTRYNHKNSVKFIIAILIIFILRTIIIIGQLNPTIKNGKSIKEFEIKVIDIFSFPNIPVYWLIGFILLIALIIAVIISYKRAKPLRSYL